MKVRWMVLQGIAMRRAHVAGLVLAVAQLGLFSSASNAESTLPSEGRAAGENSGAQSYCVGAASTNAKPLDGLNHLQYGLENMDRYYKRNPKAPPKFWLEAAIDDFNYVMKHNPGSSHIQMADILVHRAVALSLSGNDSAARQDYARALQLNPNLTKAYLGLARSYAQVGLKKEALEVATQGLRCVPSNALQQEYLKHGGKLPYPAPVAAHRRDEPGMGGNDLPSREAESPEKSGRNSITPPPPGESGSDAGVQQAPRPATDAGEPSAQTGDVTPERACRFCPPDEIQQKWRESFGQKPSR